jgi:hypothetical protein
MGATSNGAVLLATLFVGACWTNHSSAGGFVREVSESRRGLYVETCDLTLESHHNLWAVSSSNVDGHSGSSVVLKGCSSDTLSVATEVVLIPPKRRPALGPTEVLDVYESAKPETPPIEHVLSPPATQEQQ